MGRSFPCRRPPPPSPARPGGRRRRTGLTGRSQSEASVIPAQPLRQLGRELPRNGEEFSLPAASAYFTGSVSRPTSADRIDGTISIRGMSHPGAAPPAASPPPPINGEEFSLPAASASFTCSARRPTSADRIDGTISIRGISHPGAAPPAASPPPPHKWGGVFLFPGPPPPPPPPRGGGGGGGGAGGPPSFGLHSPACGV